MEATRDFTGVCRCEVPEERLAAAFERVHLLGADLAGAGAESSVFGFIEDGTFTILSICSTLANDAD